MITAISGIRDIQLDSERVVVSAMRALVAHLLEDGLHELRFGGALGVDTVALEAARACTARSGAVLLKVIVPFTVGRQPVRACEAIDRCADAVVELKLPATERTPYLVRNNALLHRADQLVAFTDSRNRGGTAYTIRRAGQLRIHVVQHLVRAYS